MNNTETRTESTRIVLSTTALNILSLALPIMTLQVYDRILPNPDSGTLPVLLAGVCIAVVVEVILRLARAWVIAWNGAVYEQALSSSALHHLLEAETRAPSAYGIGDLLSRLSGIAKMKEFHNGYVVMTATEMFFVPVFLGVILYIAPPLALIPIVLLVAFGEAAYHQSYTLRKAMEKREEDDDARYNFLIECLKGIHTLKANAAEKLFARRYESLQEKSGLSSYHAAQAATASFNAGATLSHLMMVLIMAVGAAFAVKGMITTGALIATLQLSGRMMQPVQRGLLLLAKLQDYKLAKERLAHIFDLPTIQRKTAVELPAAEGTLSLRNISYGGALKNVSLDIKSGETVAISGDEDSGRKELLEILSGLYPPDSGEVLVDGLDMRNYTPEELSERIGAMSGEGVIFRGTVRDNITRFGQTAEPKAREIARLLNVDAEVARLPLGLDTFLQGDSADPVPPGLKQRISMTRTLSTHPKIIVFDEADRGLDRIGYNLAFGMLAKLKRRTAMILSTDDANIASLAQRRFVMENGALHERQ